MKKILRKANNLITIFYCLIGINTLFFLIFFAKHMMYGRKKNFVENNIIIFVCALCMVVLIYGLYIFLKKKINKEINYVVVIRVLTVVLFVLQIYISYNIFFYTSWDVGDVILPTAKGIAEGKVIISNLYYSIYPNNLFITSIFAKIFSIGNFFGIHSMRQLQMIIIVINCFVSSLSCYLTARIIHKLTNAHYAFLGFVLIGILVGLSPWITICYSDSFVLVLPVLIIYLYLYLPCNNNVQLFLKIFAVVTIPLIGYKIKPQVIIVLIAITIAELLKFQGALFKKNIKYFILAVALGGVIFQGLNVCMEKVYQKEGFKIEKEMAYGPTHFFMMGLNSERLGMYSGKDVLLSQSVKTKKQRTELNIKESKRRLKKFGAIGYIKFIIKKQMCNYNDGTFGWGQEGIFFSKIYPEKKLPFAHFLRNCFYNSGKHNLFVSEVEQGAWLVVILLAYVGFIFCKRKDNRYIMSMVLSIIGVTLFQLLFEARARYLYIYIPIFVIMAMDGLKNTYDFIKERRKV